MGKGKYFSDKADWFNERGSHYDVVVSSRARLSRNLTGFLFPGMMDDDESSRVRQKVMQAVQKIGGDKAEDGGRLTPLFIKELNPLERKMLIERGLISQSFSLNKENLFLLSMDQKRLTLVNETDHLRYITFCGGLDLKTVYSRARELENSLEEQLGYACDLSWGYLNTQITNLGTGLRVSAMLFLPGLELTHAIQKVLKALVQFGVAVKGYFGSDRDSLGSLYQISNQHTLGSAEEQIVEKLENIALQLVNYERKIRQELLEKRRKDLEDRVMRSYGVLKYCRYISSTEAIKRLADLRLGTSLGMIDIPLEKITALQFMVQRSHVQDLISGSESGSDEKLVDYTRAKLIRTSLEDL